LQESVELPIMLSSAAMPLEEIRTSCLSIPF